MKKLTRSEFDIIRKSLCRSMREDIESVERVEARGVRPLMTVGFVERYYNDLMAKTEKLTVRK